MSYSGYSIWRIQWWHSEWWRFSLTNQQSALFSNHILVSAQLALARSLAGGDTKKSTRKQVQV